MRRFYRHIHAPPREITTHGLRPIVVAAAAAAAASAASAGRRGFLFGRARPAGQHLTRIKHAEAFGHREQPRSLSPHSLSLALSRAFFVPTREGTVHGEVWQRQAGRLCVSRVGTSRPPPPIPPRFRAWFCVRLSSVVPKNCGFEYGLLLKCQVRVCSELCVL